MVCNFIEQYEIYREYDITKDNKGNFGVDADTGRDKYQSVVTNQTW